MWRVGAIIVLAGSGASCLSAQGDASQGCATTAEFAPVIVTNVGSTVTFKCDRASPLDVIRAIGRQTRLPIGVVLGEDPDALSKASHSYDLEKLGARPALREAIRDTGYSLKEENHVMVLVAGDVTRRQRELLAYRYSDFGPGSNPTMVELGVGLTMWMRAVIDPEGGFGGSIPGSFNDERFTLEGTWEGTTEEIADRIVCLGSKGMWIFRADASAASVALTDEVDIEPYQHYSNGPNVQR